jgi:putative transposase
MQVMGLQAIYPKPKTTVAAKDHQVYPYLLRHLEITRPNQVWSADITYVPLRRGFMRVVITLAALIPTPVDSQPDVAFQQPSL